MSTASVNRHYKDVDVDEASNKLRYCKESDNVERNLLEDDPSNRTTDGGHTAGNNKTDLDTHVYLPDVAADLKLPEELR